VDRLQLAILREGEGACYVGSGNSEASSPLDGVELKVTNDGSTVERV